jgi:hypothetical protein
MRLHYRLRLPPSQWNSALALKSMPAQFLEYERNPIPFAQDAAPHLYRSPEISGHECAFYLGCG